MIDSYSFGAIAVDGAEYHRDLIVYPERVQDGWRRKEGHSLGPSDLKEVFQYHPDVLVVGQGAYGRMKIADATLRRANEEGIELVAADTANSVQRFNEEMEKGAKVVGAFHLTC